MRRQELIYTFQRPDFNWANCGPLSNFNVLDTVSDPVWWRPLTELDERSNFLLPQEWVLPEKWLQVERLDWNGAGQCKIKISIERNPTIYLMKNTLLDVLVVLAGLAATQLNPMMPPFLGARIGTLMTSMLMTINKSARRDLGFGRLGYM